YNAGEDRVDQWRKDGNFKSVEEFVESIPFTETREYVQAIMRNAVLYRLLYPKGLLPVLSLPLIDHIAVVACAWNGEINAASSFLSVSSAAVCGRALREHLPQFQNRREYSRQSLP